MAWEGTTLSADCRVVIDGDDADNSDTRAFDRRTFRAAVDAMVEKSARDGD